jgi:hypothetical protein
MVLRVEARWFGAGIVPADVGAWFYQDAPQPQQEPLRTDCYLHLPGQDSLGIKLREGSLELKQRACVSDVVHFDGRIAGHVEHWHKWRFMAAETDHGLAADQYAEGSWIAVEKDRRLRTYHVTDTKEVMAVPLPVMTSTDLPQQGCHLELTILRVDDKQWWSVGFAAFGDEDALQDTLLLHLVAAHGFAGTALPALAATNSYGYPRWLSDVHPSGRRSQTGGGW